MAATVGTSGFGTILAIGDGATSESFANVTEVVNISGPSESLELIDATHMESPSTYREYLPSLLDSGEVTFDLNFLPGTSTQNVLRTDMGSRTRRNFRITWTDTATGPTVYTFAAFITAFEPSAQIDDKLSASCTLKVTGPITVT